MKTIKQILDDSIQQIPELALRNLLGRKVKKAGHDIPEEGIKALAKHILSGATTNFTWSEHDQGSTKNIKLHFTENDFQQIKDAVDGVVEAIPDLVLKVTDQASTGIFEDLRARWEIEHAAQTIELENFRSRLEDDWGPALDYLRMLLTCCREVGDWTLKRYAKSKSKRHMYRREVLLRLHLRACQVSDEILCLMENGFPNGAMARWRTLYEISVVAILIADGDEALAERYIAHDAVEIKRQADSYEEHDVTTYGARPVPKKDRSAIDRDYEAVIEQFGPQFAHAYGWAADHLGLKKPTFKNLQVAADRTGMATDYKVASFNIHAGARRLFFDLGSVDNSSVPTAGRSNTGLVEPGIRTAQTLALITNLFVGNTPNIDRLVERSTLIKIRDAVPPALVKAERKLHRRHRAGLKQPSSKQKR